MNMPFGTLDRRPPPFFKQGPSALNRMLVYSVLSVCLMVVDLRLQLTAPLRSAISMLIYPFQQATLAPVRWSQELHDYWSGLNQAQAERAQLQIQLVQQSQRILQMQQLELENQRLRDLLKLQPRLKVNSMAAEVLYQTADPFTQKVLLNRGGTQGVRLGSPVIDERGVLGQVTRVYPLNCEVTLLTDKDAAIPVINARSQERVIAFGQPESNAMELRFMAGNADVQVGDELRTSGLDGIYLTGLPVAKVLRVDRRADSAFAHIVLEPTARLRGMRHVLILEPVAVQLPVTLPADSKLNPTTVRTWSANNRASDSTSGGVGGSIDKPLRSRRP